MKLLKINLNDCLYVKLGEAEYLWWLNTFKDSPAQYRPSLETLKSYEKDGLVQFQIHEFIRIFGPIGLITGIVDYLCEPRPHLLKWSFDDLVYI